MQDYGVLGIHSMEDRKRLFQLIVNLKSKLKQPSIPTFAKASRPESKSYNAVDVSDEEDSPHFARKLARSVPAVNSPKQSRNNLNAYGVPLTIASNSNIRKASLVSDRIRVCVRKRPLSTKETRKGETDIARVTGRRGISIVEPKVKVDLTKYVENHEFMFDEAFDADATNDDVYKRTALPLVGYMFEGGKATCFAYGQTGSGKTYTMLDSTNGLYVKAGRDIFNLLQQPTNSHLKAYISFFEIYQGQLYDLLGNRTKLYAREDGKQQVIIKGMQEFQVDNVSKLMQIFEAGNSTRSTGATGANSDSSRSHAIFQIVLKHENKKIQGKLSFIDLAGSERGADRGETDKQTRMEGSEINKSLLALKECIRALDQDSKHTPFRQSKLTQVLKDSFIGNSRTCMIATITPNMSNSEHSLNTLRYADRVKELRGNSNNALDQAQVEDEVLGDELIEHHDDEFLEDEEFPPFNDQSDEEDELKKVDRRTLTPYRIQKEVVPEDDSESDIDESHLNIRSLDTLDDLCALHRANIISNKASEKQESVLLMKLKRNDRLEMDEVADEYIKQLEIIVDMKMDSLKELKSMIQRAK